MTWEKRITERMRSWGEKSYNFWYAIAVYALFFYLVAAAGFAYAGWFPDWRHFPLLIIGTYIVVNILQLIIRRERPSAEKAATYKMWWKSYSCPSGHSTGAAVSATFLILAIQFPNASLTVQFAEVFIGLALLIAVSRIIVGVHYFFDIVAGLVLGTLLALGYSLFVL